MSPRKKYVIPVWAQVLHEKVCLEHQREEEHQIALELESKLQFMTERCKGLEERLAQWESMSDAIANSSLFNRVDA